MNILNVPTLYIKINLSVENQLNLLMTVIIHLGLRLIYIHNIDYYHSLPIGYLSRFLHFQQRNLFNMKEKVPLGGSIKFYESIIIFLFLSKELIQYRENSSFG
jgi:hypothetical protein